MEVVLNSCHCMYIQTNIPFFRLQYIFLDRLKMDLISEISLRQCHLLSIDFSALVISLYDGSLNIFLKEHLLLNIVKTLAVDFSSLVYLPNRSMSIISDKQLTFSSNRRTKLLFLSLGTRLINNWLPSVLFVRTIPY